MALYEHIFLVRQDALPTLVESLTDKYKSVIEEHGGKIAKSEYWGLKHLVYKINKNSNAHFTLMNIDAGHEAVAEMERQMRISDDVLRFLTLKVDEHEEGPSIMMRDKRDDR